MGVSINDWRTQYAELSPHAFVARLARACERRDAETGAHIHRMGLYAGLLASEIGLDPQTVHMVRMASPLHDIGKIGIPDRILRKPGRFVDDEYAHMKTHATLGYRFLRGSRLPLLQMAATIAWTHHERWDGGGYPRGLRGTAIPLVGRIVAIVDVFDALLSRRVYKPAFTLEHAVDLMNEGRETHFDPALLDAFLRRLGDVVAIHRRYPDDDADTQEMTAFFSAREPAPVSQEDTVEMLAPSG